MGTLEVTDNLTENATITMSLKDYSEAVTLARLQGTSSGQNNFLQIYRAFKTSLEDKLQIPYDLQVDLKRMIFDFMEELKVDFKRDQQLELDIDSADASEEKWCKNSLRLTMS